MDGNWMHRKSHGSDTRVAGSGGGSRDGMEARVARLEVHVQHLQSDVTEIKADVKNLYPPVVELRSGMNTSFAEQRKDMNASLTEQRKEMNASLTELRKEMHASVTELRRDLAQSTAELTKSITSVRESIGTACVWAVGLYAGLAVSLLATVTKGFGLLK